MKLRALTQPPTPLPASLEKITADLLKIKLPLPQASLPKTFIFAA